MVFSPNPRLKTPKANIKIGEEKLEQVRVAKFLGILVDEKLTWKDHVVNLSKKVAKTIGIIGKARKYLSRKSLIQLYYAFAYPLLLYGNIIWGNSNQTTLGPIAKIQKIIVRMIANLPKYSSISGTFQKLEIIKIEDIYRLQATAFMHKAINLKLPPVFDYYFHRSEQIQPYNTRICTHLRPPNYDTAVGKLFIKFTGTFIWNEIKTAKEHKSTLYVLKRRTIVDILSSY